MFIETVPNRNSPPAILLRESYREDGKVKKRTLLNLTGWAAAHVQGLRVILKGGTAVPPGEDPLIITRSLPHGHVAAIPGTVRSCGLDRMLGPEGSRLRDLVLGMIVSRIAGRARSSPRQECPAGLQLAPARARCWGWAMWQPRSSTRPWIGCWLASPM